MGNKKNKTRKLRFTASHYVEQEQAIKVKSNTDLLLMEILNTLEKISLQLGAQPSIEEYEDDVQPLIETKEDDLQPLVEEPEDDKKPSKEKKAKKAKKSRFSL